MSCLKIVIVVMLLGSFSFAQEQKSGNKQPQLLIQQSNFVEFKSSNISESNGTIAFEGKFIVLGDAIYGHFDIIATTDSGKVIQKVMSADRAWKRDHGGNLKSITLSMSAKAPARVEVSFHEMRVSPESGACKK